MLIIIIYNYRLRQSVMAGVVGVILWNDHPRIIVDKQNMKQGFEAVLLE